MDEQNFLPDRFAQGGSEEQLMGIMDNVSWATGIDLCFAFREVTVQTTLNITFLSEVLFAEFVIGVIY